MQKTQIWRRLSPVGRLSLMFAAVFAGAHVLATIGMPYHPIVDFVAFFIVTAIVLGSWIRLYRSARLERAQEPAAREDPTYLLAASAPRRSPLWLRLAIISSGLFYCYLLLATAFAAEFGREPLPSGPESDVFYARIASTLFVFFGLVLAWQDHWIEARNARYRENLARFDPLRRSDQPYGHV